MAAAAETIKRSPESEIYGRSLGTIYRLGAFAVDKSSSKIIHSPEAEQARIEFYTSVEEGFGTDMELGGGLEVRDFDRRPVIDGKVMSKDLKTAVSDMTGAGLKCAIEKYAIETTKGDERFLPQLVRSEHDHNNALIVDQMARGETDYNTRIIASLYPEEAAAESGDEYWRNIGYVPHLKRGFIQFYYASEDGLVSGSLSFDGSNKERLREIFSSFDINVPELETTDNWLQHAITDTLPEETARELALEIANCAGDPGYKKNTNTVEVTSEHREIMDTVFNGSYIHVCESLFRGYQTDETRELVLQLANEAHHFNHRYREALYKMRSNGDNFTDHDSIVLHELLVYSTIEMMRALHLKKESEAILDGTSYKAGSLSAEILKSLDAASFQSMLGSFGAEGARNNRSYSACGLAISPGESDGSADSPQRAFGGKDCPEIKNGQKVKCPHCKKEVNAIVPDDKKSIYCSNKKCKMAAPSWLLKK